MRLAGPDENECSWNCGNYFTTSGIAALMAGVQDQMIQVMDVFTKCLSVSNRGVLMNGGVVQAGVECLSLFLDGQELAVCSLAFCFYITQHRSRLYNNIR